MQCEPRLLAVLFVFVLVGLPHVGGQSGPAPDLLVTHIRITGDDPQWIEGQAPTTSLAINITNRGTGQATGYTITYEWEKDGQRTYLRGSQTNSIDAYSDILGPGNERTIQLPKWSLQPEQVDQGEIIVTITANGRDADRANDEARHTLFVPYRDVDLVVQGDDQTVNPEETRFFRVQVRNDGNVAEPVLLTHVNIEPHERLEAQIYPDHLTVPAHSNRSTHLYVHYPFTGDLEPFTQSYDITLDTTYGRSHSTLTPSLNSLPADRVYRLRYEDFVRQPVTVLRELAEFLGIEADEADHPRAAGHVSSASVGTWRERLSREQRSAIEPVLGPVLARHGYLDRG